MRQSKRVPSFAYGDSNGILRVGMRSLSFEIKNQIVQVFGTAFHYKDPMESFLRSAGVGPELSGRHKDKPKFVWARNLLSDLEIVENGYDIQRRILTELCKLRKLPDNDVPNPDAGLNSLRILKQMAVEHDLFVEEEKKKTKNRNQEAEERARIVRDRATRLEELRNTFSSAMTNPNRQEAGYTLEDILQKLFPLFEIDFRKSYRTPTQQIDGFFRLEGFHYLVEAKWRSDQPNEQEIAGFRQKVLTKLDATRGVYVSINGFRPEVVNQFKSDRFSILFMDGEDLIHVLEGRVDLRELLEKKIEKAAQEGDVFFPARNMQ